MPDRSTLHKDDLDLFKQFLTSAAREYRPGRGDYQIMQIKQGKDWIPIYRTDRPGHEHCSVDIRLINTVNAFIRWKKQNAKRD